MTRYVPTGESAEGGIGSVMFCHDTNLDRKVAVKTVHSGDHRRLLDELAALQQIRSKHVVQIFDVIYPSAGTGVGIVEEFIDGTEMEDLLGEVEPAEEFVRLLFQMASGLTDIHAVGVIHRDIKPSNMLIDADGILKVIDFNLARPKDGAHTRGFVGTRGYAAPELYADGAVQFDEKVDVYALGVTAYALLSGPGLPDELASRPPEPGMWQELTGGFEGLDLPLDRQLVLLLDRCMDEDPTARPTAAEIADRARRVLLKGRHRALLVNEAGTPFEIYAERPALRLKHQLGEVTISYDQLDFKVADVRGEVWINNTPARQGAALPECCVIALGDPVRRAQERAFITMDSSHPEVVL